MVATCSSVQPNASMATKVISYAVGSPLASNVMATSSVVGKLTGACPFPKLHTNKSAFSLLLINVVFNGSHPWSTVISKAAVGCGLMCTVAEAVPIHPSMVCPSNETTALMSSSERFSHVWIGVNSLEDVPSPKFQVTFCAPAISGMVITNGEHTESTVNAKLKSAAGNTVTLSVSVSEQPSASIAVRVTL